MVRTCLLALSLAAAGLPAAAGAAELSLTVAGVEDRGGKLYISVQRADEFMQNAGTAGNIIDAPAAGDAAMTFDVPAGTYAISVWHDFNGNGTFDMGPDGMPADGWAMSGPALQGEPSFEDVAVEVPEAGKSVRVEMSY